MGAMCEVFLYLVGKDGIDHEGHMTNRAFVERQQAIDHRFAANPHEQLGYARPKARPQSSGGNDEQS